MSTELMTTKAPTIRYHRGIRAARRKKRRRALLCLVLAALAAGTVLLKVLPLAGMRAAEETVCAAETLQAEEELPASGRTEQGQAADPADTVLPGEGILVCVDPGHGGNDPGTHDPNDESRVEKDDVLQFALVLKDALEAQGIEVLMTRTDDSLPSLDERCEMANEAEADYYLSIHRNSAAADACGVELWRSSAASQETIDLGDAIMSGLEDVGIQRNRGVNEGSQGHDGDYKVLRCTKMPSLLLEMGFMQDEEDNRLFDENQQEYAEAITQAVLSVYQSCHGETDSANEADGR